MGVLNICGFETGIAGNEGGAGGVGLRVQSDVAHINGHALLFANQGDGGSGFTIGMPYGYGTIEHYFDADTLYVRFYVRYAGAGHKAFNLDIWSIDPADPVNIMGAVNLTIDSSGFLVLSGFNWVTLATWSHTASTHSLFVNRWNRIEVKVEAGENNGYEVRLDGETAITSATAGTEYMTGGIGAGYTPPLNWSRLNFADGAGTGPCSYIDDIMIRDDDWCGPGHCVRLNALAGGSVPPADVFSLDNTEPPIVEVAEALSSWGGVGIMASSNTAEYSAHLDVYQLYRENLTGQPQIPEHMHINGLKAFACATQTSETPALWVGWGGWTAAHRAIDDMIFGTCGSIFSVYDLRTFAEISIKNLVADSGLHVSQIGMMVDYYTIPVPHTGRGDLGLNVYKMGQTFECGFMIEDSVGAPSDPVIDPKFTVIEEGNEFAITGPEPCGTRAWGPGYWGASAEITDVEPGGVFIVGKTYFVIVNWIMDGVEKAMIAGTFRVIPSTVWDWLLGGIGNVAAAFYKFFNKTAPTGTINSIPDAVAGQAGGLALSGEGSSAAEVLGATVPGAYAQGTVGFAIGLLASGDGVLTGTVLDDDALPIDGCDVQAYNNVDLTGHPAQSTVTLEDGSYSLRLPRENWWVRYDKPGKISKVVAITAADFVEV